VSGGGRSSGQDNGRGRKRTREIRGGSECVGGGKEKEENGGGWRGGGIGGESRGRGWAGVRGPGRESRKGIVGAKEGVGVENKK